MVPGVAGSSFREAVRLQEETQHVGSSGSFRFFFFRNAFVKKEHVLTIFFDLEKAYDTTWKHGILADLWDLGFRGHLPRFI